MADLVLGTDIETQLPVTLGETARLQGLYVPGLTGTGKSTLLLNMICQDMAAGHGVAVFDPKGDLSRDVLERVPDHRVDDVIVLDPLDYRHPFGLNLFECPYPEDRLFAAQTQERVMHVFEKIWYPDGDMLQSAPQLVEVLSNLTYLLISNPEYTMAEIPRILSDQRFRAPLVNKIHNAYVKQWWIQKYNNLGRVGNDQADYTASTVRRIERFLQNPILLSIVGQNKTSVDLRQVMDEGKILLVRLPVVSLGEDAVTLLGSILISQVLIAALSRENIPESQRRFFALYADEYHRFAIADFASLLAEARAFGLATTIAHQYLGQLDRNNQSAVKSTVNKVVFQVNPDDAHEFSRGFFHEPDKGEITGYRPVQAISQEPVDDLIKRGHPDHRVMELVNDSIKNLNRLESTLMVLPDHDHDRRGKNRFTAVAIRNVNAAINQYLVSMMKGELAPGSEDEARIIGEALVRLRYPFFQMGGLERFEFGSHKYYFRVFGDRELAKLIKDMLIHEHGVIGDERVLKALMFAQTVRALGKFLSTQPILANTAAMEPIYERPRAYNDVQAEVASKLAHMRIRQAQIRVIQDLEVREYAIATNPPPPVPADVHLKKQLISLRSRTTYARPLELVEAEIAKRQKPPEPGPPDRLE